VVPDLFSSDPAPEFYANAARFAHGPFDFVFEFAVSQIADTVSIEPPTNRPVAIVRMSPQHAKVFATALAQQLVNFEEVNGKINLPSNIREQFGI
jgi:hypothetical protein